MTASGLELKKIILALVLTLLVLTLIASGAKAQEIQPDADQSQSEAMRDGPDAGDTAESVLPSNEDQFPVDVTGFFDRRWADRLLPAALTFGVMSLAPALLLMTTCFVRMSVVLSLTRQAIGTVNLPSTQIITSLALFLSALVMWPIWTSAYQAGIEPYQAGEITLQEALERGSLPVRRWMAYQIEEADNRDTVALFLQRHPGGMKQVDSYDEIPTEVLLPAFLVSELEVAFMIGFRILLPFLVLDCVVATLVVSTGLVMLPPTIVSLPLKLLVFVMADGWSLVVRGLLDGVRLNTS
jgi:flagellar biosynthetic protein FliP